MLKLVGSLLLVLTGLVLAVSVCSFEKKKLSVLDSFIALLLYIKGQIDCYSMPLCDILENGAQKTSLVSDTGNICDFGRILSSSRMYLDDESYRLLLSFYSEFGSVYREEQLRRLDYYINALGERRRAVFEDLPARTRVGSALCICGVLGILIIIW